MPAMRDFFQRRGKFRPEQADDDRSDLQIPEDLWIKCPKCGELIYSRELERRDRSARNAPTISGCAHASASSSWSIPALRRVARRRSAGRPSRFADGAGPYDEKLERTQSKSGEREALVVGAATIDGLPATLAVSDFEFLGASMGSVYGEKLVRAVEWAADRRTPLVTVSSSGGARMHEGLFSLMQMAKTVAALAQLGRAGVPHFALLADPCYGGVTASYATVADVVLAEPGRSSDLPVPG